MSIVFFVWSAMVGVVGVDWFASRAVWGRLLFACVSYVPLFWIAAHYFKRYVNGPPSSQP